MRWRQREREREREKEITLIPSTNKPTPIPRANTKCLDKKQYVLEPAYRGICNSKTCGNTKHAMFGLLKVLAAIFYVIEDITFKTRQDKCRGSRKKKKKRKKKGKRKREKIMFAHRSTLLVYSLELPFASFIDFFSSRYENSFEWPDGTRGLLKADERVYFSVTENPKWRPDTGTPVEWPYKGNALNSSSWNNADERKTRGNSNVSFCV